MIGEYVRFSLTWEGLSIEVGCQANWLSSGYWHIELRCDDRLPVTETGYRSHFVPMADLADEGAICAFVIDWLDAVASQPSWLRHLEDSRQLKLF